MTTDPPGVWIADAHPIFRRGLVACLHGEPGLALAGESEALPPAAALEDTAVLVFDLEAPAALPRGPRLVGLLRREDRLYEALAAGLAGVLVRSTLTPTRFVACLRAVLAGHGALPPDLLADVLANGGARGVSATRLATREVDVLRLLAEGESTRDIAGRLAYSERTVKNIVHDLLTKLNCRTRAHAVAQATRQGVI